MWLETCWHGAQTVSQIRDDKLFGTPKVWMCKYRRQATSTNILQIFKGEVIRLPKSQSLPISQSGCTMHCWDYSHNTILRRPSLLALNLLLQSTFNIFQASRPLMWQGEVLLSCFPSGCIYGSWQFLRTSWNVFLISIYGSVWLSDQYVHS